MHTDKKNIIYPNETSLRVKRWKLLLSEYRLSLHFIKGIKKVGADAFYQMRFDTSERAQMHDEINAATDDPVCVMHGPVILQHQERDETTQTISSAYLAGQKNPDYKLLALLGCTLVAFQGRVVVPDTLRDDLLDWYHHNLGHAGPNRLYKTMRQSLYWTAMKSSIIKRVKLCLTCKRAKVHGARQDYGLLPPRTFKTVTPWYVVHVDLIVPYDG